MDEFRLSSPSQQLAAYLRSQLIQGRWSVTMPGSPALARELGIDSKTVWAALGLLEKEGLLAGQGPGRPRKIILAPTPAGENSLRIAILEYDPESENTDYMVELRHQLRKIGHQVIQPRPTLTQLQMKIPLIQQLVAQTEVDAWIVCSASRQVLEWFSKQSLPTFAFFGRRRGLPLAGAGPDHEKVATIIARRLVKLGHKRIVVLARESQRTDGPGRPNQAIFDEMNRSGIVTGSFNFPDWKDSAEGLLGTLDNLFKLTPPSALIIDEPFVFHAVKDHLARKGILAPDHVTLICRDPDLSFLWLRPTVAHVHWNPQPVLRRVIKWASKISQGIKDQTQSLTEAKFVEGETIGPAPKG